MATSKKGFVEKGEYFDLVYSSSKKGGRPKKILNENGLDAIRKLSAIMCTDEEIAAFLGVSCDTLVNRNNKKSFSEHKKAGQDKGKASIRRLQFKSAEKGNVSMLIWLGKQYLGQAEKQETTIQDTNINFEIIGK